MAKQRIDRRVMRTRAALQKAFLSLLHTKRYDAITVEEICVAADVGRSTFYAHYPDKDELKRGTIDTHLRTILTEHRHPVQTAPASTTRFGFSLAMFEHARDYIEIYRALAGTRGGTVALGAIRELLCDLVRRDVVASGASMREAPPRDFMVQFVVGAYMAVLTWWLDDGARLPPERMDAMFRQLLTTCLGA